MKRSSKNVFRFVKCRGYITKYRHIDESVVVDPKTNTFTRYDKYGETSGLKEVSMARTYYTPRCDSFSGMYVGEKTVVVHAKVKRTINNSGSQTYEKLPVTVERCAIVYYAPNRRHLVPISQLEEE